MKRQNLPVRKGPMGFFLKGEGFFLFFQQHENPVGKRKMYVRSTIVPAINNRKNKSFISIEFIQPVRNKDSDDETVTSK